MRVLLVDDDREIAGYIGRGLEEEGSTVTACFDGAEGLRTALASAFDIVVLDVMLPSLDGFEITRRLRARNVHTPILLLTCRDAARDVVKGLDAGADDYLTKPFSFDVLLARLRARTRASHAGTSATLLYSDLSMNVETHEVCRAKMKLNLTRTEFAILESLIRSAGRVVSRQRLIETVWGSGREVGDNNLDVFIRFLRTKVDAPPQPRLIRTIRGIGYSLREDA